MTDKPYNILFAEAMEAINIQFDRQRRNLRSEYERGRAEIAANEGAAITEAKQNVRAARARDLRLIEEKLVTDIFHEGESYVVICRDDGAPHATGITVGRYTLATRQAFPTRRKAQNYADTLAPTREPLVVEGFWDQIHFGAK